MTAAVTSFPRTAGRQCRKNADGLPVAAMSSSVTRYGSSSRTRSSSLASSPMDTQTSV